jgi:hypothetical protein
MNIDTETEQKLRRVGAELNGDRGFVDAVMSHIERANPPIASSYKLPRWVVVAVSLAACVGIAIPVLVVMFKSPSLAYADVVKAIEDVKTAKLEMSNPATKETVRCFYERGVGFRMDGMMNHTKVLVVDDGRHQWMSSAGAEVLESPSTGLIEQFKKALLDRALLDGAKRDRTGDAEIDGAKCQLFVRKMKENSPGARIWIDDRERVRKMEVVELRNGKEQVTQAANAQYDLPIDRALFAPPVVAVSKPASLDERINQYFPLDTAPAKIEVFGLVLAVHEVRAAPDGMLLVRSSIRPNDETLKKFGAGLAWQALANYQLDIADYQPIQMGSYQKQRMTAQWDFFMPIRPGKTAPKKVVVRAIGVWTDEGLAESLEAEGKRTYINDLAIGQVNVTPAKSIDELLDETWQQASSLNSIFTPVFFMGIKAQKAGKTVYQTTPIKEWTRERLKSEFDARVKILREWHDREQRKAGGGK